MSFLSPSTCGLVELHSKEYRKHENKKTFLANLGQKSSSQEGRAGDQIRNISCGFPGATLMSHVDGRPKKGQIVPTSKNEYVGIPWELHRTDGDSDRIRMGLLRFIHRPPPLVLKAIPPLGTEISTFQEKKNRVGIFFESWIRISWNFRFFEMYSKISRRATPEIRPDNWCRSLTDAENPSSLARSYGDTAENKPAIKFPNNDAVIFDQGSEISVLLPTQN